MITSQAVSRLSLSAFFSLLSLSGLAQPQPKPSYSLRFDQVPAGEITGTELFSEAYPLNKTFDQFTPKEKSVLRSYYKGMPETDEPPFPQLGMKDIILNIRSTIDKGGKNWYFRSPRLFSFIVSINKSGKATGFRDSSRSIDDYSKAIGNCLMRIKYKPAKCNGAPCAQDFPFKFYIL